MLAKRGQPSTLTEQIAEIRRSDVRVPPRGRSTPAPQPIGRPNTPPAATPVRSPEPTEANVTQHQFEAREMAREVRDKIHSPDFKRLDMAEQNRLVQLFTE